MGPMGPMNRGDPCCAANSDWGGTRALCFQPEGRNRGTDWAYVGEGRGGYEQVQTYQYVGEGRGTFDKREGVTYGWQMRGCCICLSVLIAVGLGVLIFEPLFQNEYQDAYVGAHHISSGLTYTCSSSVSHWMTQWSTRHKEWCCRHHGRFCDTATQPYDCQAGFTNNGQGWPEGKKFWCCKYYGRGCATTTTSPQYDCDAGFANWERGWSDGKKSWCCARRQRGCPDPCGNSCSLHGQNHTCKNRIQYMADHNFKGTANACQLGHTEVLRECPACHQCSTANSGCRAPVTTTSEPHDCQAGLSNAQQGWSNAKKAWCCHHKKLGCAVPATTTRPPTLDGCNTHCNSGGRDLTCGERIREAARTTTRSEPNPCVAALSSVYRECSVCTVCSMQASGCAVRRLTPDNSTEVSEM